ncbi:MAG: Gfo/Idh/MocA family oxidoreductase [Muribaculaceae bacterium]|nr:Gfo/Idh/MocA family oxidoreductase [Muribaculaceae bacterium]
MSVDLTRRQFLKTGAMASLAMAVMPSSVLGKSFSGVTAPSDKLNILGVGIGGRGASVLNDVSQENIIGLCDVDWKYADHIFRRYPNAKRYNDYRRMYDEMLKDADAVVVATADHTHAIISADALVAGKHVYCEKPLTHTVYESRLLTRLADKHKVATQMGNQGASGDGVRKICDWIWNGEIGEVTRVDAFTDRPIWPQGLSRPVKSEKIPSTLNWDAFLGPAPERPYHSCYHPWNFRGWWDFGTGALGDMACHILHPAFKALNLRYPTHVEGSSTLLLTESAPNAQRIKYTFPRRDNMPKVGMPEVEITWYDGGILPERPAGLPDGKDLNDQGGALIFYGTKDTLICGCYGVNPYLLSGRVPEAPSIARKVELSHGKDWVRACKEDYAHRTPSASDFSEAGPFNEMVVMGVLAARLQGLNQVLDWDGENMRFTNIPEDATIRTCIADGFHIKDGHPTFDKTWSDPVNARQYAESLIRKQYRDGWKLPEMPA